MAANKLLYAHGENVSDTAPNSIGAADTSITVNTISKWNVNGGPIVINRGASDQEYAIASGVSGSSLTISLRGAYGSTAVAHNANATIESVPFAHQWNDMLTSILNLFKPLDGNIDITKLFGANYVADTGAANAYVATLVPALASYTAGVVVAFKAANANTGASTLNVNGLGVKSIVKLDGATALSANDIVAGQLCVCVYDGVNFQLLSAITKTTNQTLITPIIASIVNTGTLTLPTSTDTIVGRATTDTLTNKRRTRRVVTVTQSATPAINSDNMDVASITGIAQAITSMTTSLTGTPVTGDLLEIQFTDNGTARAITWGASFVSTTIPLPTTTVISTLLRVLLEWNGTAWACVATA